MLKQADSQMKRFETAYKSAVTKTTRAKFDASSVLTKWRSTLDELKAAIAKLKAGDYGDDPMQTLRDEFFDRSDEVNQYQQTVDMVLNAKSQMKRIATALKKYEKTIARLEKKKEDMTEAKSLLAEMKAKYDELAKVVSGGLDPDEVQSAMDDMDGYMDLQNQIEDILHLAPQTVFDQQMQAPPPGGSLKLSVTSATQSLASVQTLRGGLIKVRKPVGKTLLAQFGIQDESGLVRLVEGVKSQAVALAGDGSSLPTEFKAGIRSTLLALGE
jgi:myosin heavy subunit